MRTIRQGAGASQKRGPTKRAEESLAHNRGEYRQVKKSQKDERPQVIGGWTRLKELSPAPRNVQLKRNKRAKRELKKQKTHEGPGRNKETGEPSWAEMGLHKPVLEGLRVRGTREIKKENPYRSEGWGLTSN